MSTNASRNGQADQPRSHSQTNCLLPHHRDELHRSGLFDETILAAGIYSETKPDAIATILNRPRAQYRIAPAMVFPFLRSDGFWSDYSRIKPDNPRTRNGRVVKYESPIGQPNRAYFPAGVHTALNDPEQPLIITEGEKKALAANQAGFIAIGLVGIWGWKQPRGEALLTELEEIEWPGRNVYIVFDSDVQSNDQILNAERRLAAALQQRGADVRLVRIPGGEPNEDGEIEKVGLDDFLVTSGVEAFQQLLQDAEGPPENSPMQTKVEGSQLDACRVTQNFLALQQQDGVPRIVHWRGAFYCWDRGKYREMRDDIVKAKLINYLNEVSYALKNGVIADHFSQLKAQAMLPDELEPPCWIGDPPRDWSPLEVLPCQNGLVHLPSLIANQDFHHPATPRFFSFSTLEFDFRLNTPPPHSWLAFLRQLWGDDLESICLLQEWFGYCLTADTRQQKILMLLGPKRSGKGTLARILKKLVGESNVVGPTLASLTTDFGLWPLLDKSLAIVADARLGGQNKQALIERLLSISGEDTLTVNRKQLSMISRQLPTRFMVMSNELPKLYDASGALAGRIILLRLTQSWFGQEDTQLLDRLIPELPGILLWAIQGWQRLHQRGHFVEPASAEFFRTDLNDLTSPVSAFVRECCVVGSGQEVSRDDLYQAYRQWCVQSGENYVPNKAGFGRDLRAVLPMLGERHPRTPGSDGRVRTYTGIRLRVAQAD